jgi:glucose-1-phosphate cytidylyltransferase
MYATISSLPETVCQRRQTRCEMVPSLPRRVSHNSALRQVTETLKRLVAAPGRGRECRYLVLGGGVLAWIDAVRHGPEATLVCAIAVCIRLHAMKAVILAGGVGSRLSEETAVRPKPMVEIGGKPILWHIMKIYASHGIDEFVICLGYKGYVIKEFFANYHLHTCDLSFDLGQGDVQVHRSRTEPWKVTLVDTGEATMTGGRLKRVLPYVGEESFCFTYGDGLADVDITALISYHREQGALATVTAVQPPGRFGAVELNGTHVRRFEEKPRGDGAWLNGGYFVLSPEVGRYLEDDETIWEDRPLRALTQAGQLASFRHRGFWQAMDTLRDRNQLEQLWRSGDAPWQVWK